MPLGATRIIPREWSEHHSRMVPTSMNAAVTVGKKNGPPQPVGDDFIQQWTNEYTGPARIQAVNALSRQEFLAGQTLSGRAYLVQLDSKLALTELVPGMRIKVTSCPNDAQLEGQDLWIIDPQLGSERFTRDVLASDNQTDAPSS